MREINIAMALMQQGDVYLLQLRKGDPKIGAAGLIGCFGGKIDENEEGLVAVCREIGEETSLNPSTEDFYELGLVQVQSDHDLEQVSVYAQVFRLDLHPTITVEASDGELVKMTKQEILDAKEKLTPATRAVFEELV